MPAEIGAALLGTGLGLGLKHGIDWDHIAAISDVTSSQNTQRKSLVMGTLYAVGHASLVVILGLLAIWSGTLLPDWIDNYMEITVGITLILLGVWLIFSMYRNKGQLILRSRWMILFDLIKNSYNKLNRKNTRIDLDTGKKNREYGAIASISIGVIHGIGAETGTQVLLLTAAAGATSALTGSFLLIAFVVGLIASNTLIAIGATTGFLRTSAHSKIHTVFGILIAVFSLTLGGMFILGKTEHLPIFFV